MKNKSHCDWQQKVNKEKINLRTKAPSSSLAFKVFHTEGKDRAKEEEAIDDFHAEILIFFFNLLMSCSPSFLWTVKSTRLGAKMCN